MPIFAEPKMKILTRAFLARLMTDPFIHSKIDLLAL
jgi:hypothetical protein